MVKAERAIIYEKGDFFVLIERQIIEVLRNRGTHSVVDCRFHNTPDGQSLAIARVDYLAKAAGAAIARRNP